MPPPGGSGASLPRSAYAGGLPAGASDRRGDGGLLWTVAPDSLTLSSLTEPVLCVQRALPRPDGTVVEPQELPLPPLPAPAEALLPLLGLWLLQMPLTEGLLL